MRPIVLFRQRVLTLFLIASFFTNLLPFSAYADEDLVPNSAPERPMVVSQGSADLAQTASLERAVEQVSQATGDTVNGSAIKRIFLRARNRLRDNPDQARVFFSVIRVLGNLGGALSDLSSIPADRIGMIPKFEVIIIPAILISLLTAGYSIWYRQLSTFLDNAKTNTEKIVRNYFVDLIFVFPAKLITTAFGLSIDGALSGVFDIFRSTTLGAALQGPFEQGVAQSLVRKEREAGTEAQKLQARLEAQALYTAGSIVTTLLAIGDNNHVPGYTVFMLAAIIAGFLYYKKAQKNCDDSLRG